MQWAMQGVTAMGLLEAARRVAEERLELDMRNRIQDTVRSYRHFWDPFSEMLQNSIDAINRRYGVLNDPHHYLYNTWRETYHVDPDPTYSGKIIIEIWPEARTISVTDNGVGIPSDKIESLILPEGTDKKPGKEYGYKGKGLTYLAFVSDAFCLKSRSMMATDTYEVSINDLVSWLVDDQPGRAFPDSPVPTPTIAQESLPEGLNTQVSVTLRDDYDRFFPALSSLNHCFDLARDEDRLRGMEVVLRTRTALGNTRSLFGSNPIVPIDALMRVHHPGGIWERTIPYRYYHPKEHDEFSTRSYSFEQYMAERMRVGFDGNFRCLYFRELERQIGARAPILCDFHVSAMSSTRLGHLNQNLGLEGPGLDEAALSYGVHLAITGMPTGIRVDDWGNGGHELKRYFVVADASASVSGELDAGRKGISGTRAQQISDEAKKLRHHTIETPQGSSDRFSSYSSKHLDWGATERIFDEHNDFESRVELASGLIKEHKAADPELLDKLVSISSLEHFPNSEEEVRVLFHELLARNKIKGYRTFYASGSRALYDSALTYQLELMDRNLYPQDPLGFSRTLAVDIQRARNIKEYDHAKFYNRMRMQHPQLCVEFKPSFDDFLEEVVVRPARSSKRASEIDLLVVWSDEISASVPQDSYTVASQSGDHRYLHSVTHRLSLISPEATEVQCIVLKNVLRML